ncbi:MAG: hypothetical protein H6721_28135 [Sandaracinus sp.]|nr:hypothetical protein [Sandaracinus sp.]MCB9613580.1 hypothetical protein [Sandaracinus sp.]MCB9635998.1 hypothetical protein [Sandaracinus sp.]
MSSAAPFGPTDRVLTLAACVAAGALPLAVFVWARPELAALSPLLESNEVSFGTPLRALFAEGLWFGLVLAVVLGATVGFGLRAWTGAARVGRGGLALAAVLGFAGVFVAGLGVREARELVLPAGTHACECPQTLEALERNVCACAGALVVAQIGAPGSATVFAYDEAGLVTRFELRPGGLANAPLRRCTLEPPKPIEEIASATLRCVEP